MNIKRIALWLVAVAVIACVVGYGLRRYETAHDYFHEQMKILMNPLARGQWAFGMYRTTAAQSEEWEIMTININTKHGLVWEGAMGHAMLQKANWLANRLNLPIKCPIQPWEVQLDCFVPSVSVLPQYPSWIPDTVYGMDIYNTNIPRLKRILALKFGINGSLDTPTYHFSFMDGQCDCIARQSESGGDANNFDKIMTAPHVHPPPLKTAEIYQIATNWLAAIDVNLDMLEKSRLPHPVRQEEGRLPGASSPQPVYFVAWGTNYYGLNYMAKILHTNEWSPSVLVEIGPHKELLQVSVGDLTYYHCPPVLLNSHEVWRLVHAPDPPLEQLQNPSFTTEHFFCDPHAATNYPDYWNGLNYETSGAIWRYAHHLPLPAVLSNSMQKTYSELIPYTPDTNAATP
ncbi:MAG TPA: hypothetical protein VMF08_19510 [Candidatus Sulfotelmatobacter sp.]|nr:hypothetical protein [Candidatus Sulfotelmatobacter sp.]